MIVITVYVVVSILQLMYNIEKLFYSLNIYSRIANIPQRTGKNSVFIIWIT